MGSSNPNYKTSWDGKIYQIVEVIVTNRWVLSQGEEYWDLLWLDEEGTPWIVDHHNRRNGRSASVDPVSDKYLFDTWERWNFIV